MPFGGFYNPTGADVRAISGCATMISCDAPSLGRKIADAFQSVHFDKTDTFLIRQARMAMHTPYARVLSTGVPHPRQLSIRRFINGTDIGSLFHFGGDNDAGKDSIDWHKVAMPVTAPLNYVFTVRSFHIAQSCGAGGFELAGSIHERGLHFRVKIDDTGSRMHEGKSGGDFNDYVAEFVLQIPGPPNWLVQIQREGIVVL